MRGREFQEEAEQLGRRPEAGKRLSCDVSEEKKKDLRNIKKTSTAAGTCEARPGCSGGCG